jgi:hypothetical protein
MKKLAITTASALVALAALAAGAAAAEFPYYPEYADVFSQYDELTPLMAKKATIANPSFTDNAGDVVCEPLLLKNCIGMPLCYMVATYAARNLYIVEKWNEIIKNINAGKAMPAKSLAEEMGFYYSEGIIKRFNTLTISPYTYGVPLLTASGGFPALVGYVAAYKAAAQSFGDDDFYFTGIVGTGYYVVQTFVFETDAGERMAFEVDEFGEAGLADFEARREGSRRAVSYWHDALIERPEIGKRNRTKWSDLMRAISDDQANEEFPRVGAENVSQIEWAEP